MMRAGRTKRRVQGILGVMCKGLNVCGVYSCHEESLPVGARYRDASSVCSVIISIIRTHLLYLRRHGSRCQELTIVNTRKGGVIYSYQHEAHRNVHYELTVTSSG